MQEQFTSKVNALYVRATFSGTPPNDLKLLELSLNGIDIENIENGSAWVRTPPHVKLIGASPLDHTIAEVTFQVSPAIVLSKEHHSYLLNNNHIFCLKSKTSHFVEYDGADIDCELNYDDYRATLHGHMPVVLKIADSSYYLEV